MLKWNEYRDRIRMIPYEHDDAPLSDEEKDRIADRMISYLLRERGEIAAFNMPYEKKRHVIWGYLNERMPNYMEEDRLAEWDRILWQETKERGIVDIAAFDYKHSLAVWKGDITRLNADAVVNAANSSLLGCFIPHHKCLDNVIHSCGGPQIRGDCAKIIALQGCNEQSGNAKVTVAYNLPSKYVLHTVGPMAGIGVEEEQRAQLKSCYVSCLELALEMGLKSVAFSCVSTGIFGFPNEEAAEIATGTVFNWKLKHNCDMKIVFNVFLDKDKKIYDDIMKFM